MYILVSLLNSMDLFKRSTLTNLSAFTQSDVLDGRGQINAIYTDFSKSFDQTDHEILLHKLYNNIGFSENVLLV